MENGKSMDFFVPKLLEKSRGDMDKSGRWKIYGKWML